LALASSALLSKPQGSAQPSDPVPQPNFLYLELHDTHPGMLSGGAFVYYCSNRSQRLSTYLRAAEAVLLIREPQDFYDEGEVVLDPYRLGKVTVVERLPFRDGRPPSSEDALHVGDDCE
jgi:hypothetical protein